MKSNGIRMEGTLIRHSTIRQNKERYFRLKFLENKAVLEKFKDERDETRRDKYEIHDNSTVKFSERTGAYWFTLKTNGREHRFGAQNPLARVTWIKAIEKCVHELRARSRGIEYGDKEETTEVDSDGSCDTKAATVKLEIETLAQELRGKRGIRKKTHYFEYQNVKNSFKGLHVVAWLLKNRFSPDRNRALDVGAELLTAGKLTRVDGGRQFKGEDELYVFTKSVGITPSVLVKDIDRLQKQVNGLSVEIHQVENSSEELYNLLQDQISQLKSETQKMRQHVDWLAGISLSVSCGIVIMGLWGNFSEVPFYIRAFLLVLIVSVTTMGFMILNSNISKKIIVKGLSTAKQYRGGLDKVRRGSHSAFSSTATFPRGSVMKQGRQQKHEKLTGISDRHGGGPSRRLHPTSSRNDDATSTTLSGSSDGKHSKPTGRKDWKRGGEGMLYRHFTTDQPKDCWSQPKADEFKVRGARYLVDGIKNVSKVSRFEVACCEMCAVGEKIDHIASLKHSALHRLRNESRYAEGSHPFSVNFLLIQFQLPGISFTMYMRARQNQNPNQEVCPGFSEMMNQFINGTDDYRNDRFKILPTVREGSWMVRKMVGAKPALLGKKISCTYSKGVDYLEIDVDIATSYVAQKILGVVQGYAKNLIVDLGFLIEGREEKELPEVMLGAVRFHNVDLGTIPKLEMEPTVSSPRMADRNSDSKSL